MVKAENRSDKADASGAEAAARRLAEATKARLAAIVESSNDAIIGLDLNGIVTDWNRGAEAIYGYTAEEMMGKVPTCLLPSNQQDETNFFLERVRQGTKVQHYEAVRQTKDGRLIEVSIATSPIRDDAGKIIGSSAIVRNVSSQKERERELSRMNRLYSALSHLNQAIVWTTNREALFQSVCQVLVEHGGFHMAWIGWHNPETREIEPVAVWGDENNYLGSVKVYSDERPGGLGPIGMAFRADAPRLCNDMRHNSVTLSWRPQLEQNSFQACAAFPIRLKNEICAMLAVYSDDPWFFRDKEIGLLTEAASDISFALDNFAVKAARQEVERIAENERLFSATMIDSMPGILYFYDEHGHFLRWNRNFEIVSGYTAEEIARMHPLDFFLNPEKQALQERIAEVFAKGESSIEAAFLSKDGRTTPYFFTGRRVVFNGQTCLVGVGVDISQRKRVELDLLETQGQLEAVVENLREGLVMADPGGEFLRWNPASLRMLGFDSPEEGRRWQRELDKIFELYTLDGTRLPFSQWPLGRVKRGEPLDNLEICIRRIGSSWERIFSYSGTLVRYAGNQQLAFMTLRDITERKQAEMSLRVLNKTLELQVAERTAALQTALGRAEAADRLKSSFLATMSHELRTPLNSIIGFTSIVLQGLAGPVNAEQSKQLGMVRGSARHLLQLINDVLDLSKIEAGQLEMHAEPFRLRDALEQVTALVKPLADKKGLALTLVAPPDLGEIISDRRRVEQILINLLNNAIKFTEQGSVTLTAEMIPQHQFPAPAAAPRPAVRLLVADTGMGIKPEDLPTLFQPFRQVNAGIARQYEGTGLGLVICRRLASLLGGEISVRSEWSRGSEFTVILPVQRPVAS